MLDRPARGRERRQRRLPRAPATGLGRPWRSGPTLLGDRSARSGNPRHPRSTTRRSTRAGRRVRREGTGPRTRRATRRLRTAGTQIFDACSWASVAKEPVLHPCPTSSSCATNRFPSGLLDADRSGDAAEAFPLCCGSQRPGRPRRDIWPPKSGAGLRTIGLSELATYALKSQRRQQARCSGTPTTARRSRYTRTWTRSARGPRQAGSTPPSDGRCRTSRTSRP